MLDGLASHRYRYEARERRPGRMSDTWRTTMPMRLLARNTATIGASSMKADLYLSAKLGQRPMLVASIHVIEGFALITASI